MIRAKIPRRLRRFDLFRALLGVESLEERTSPTDLGLTALTLFSLSGRPSVGETPFAAAPDRPGGFVVDPFGNLKSDLFRVTVSPTPSTGETPTFRQAAPPPARTPDAGLRFDAQQEVNALLAGPLGTSFVRPLASAFPASPLHEAVSPAAAPGGASPENAAPPHSREDVTSSPSSPSAPGAALTSGGALTGPAPGGVVSPPPGAPTSPPPSHPSGPAGGVPPSAPPRGGFGPKPGGSSGGTTSGGHGTGDTPPPSSPPPGREASSNHALPILATGTGLGEPPQVKAFDAVTGALRFQFLAYEASFQGGVRVAQADLNFDGIPDILTAPGPGRAPEVRAFDGTTGQPMTWPVGSFLAYDASFQGGVYVAAGDVNGDGMPDIVTGPDAGGGSQVRVFSGVGGTLLSRFNAYGPGFQSGVRVAAADLTGDPRAEVVVAPGPGAAPVVRAFDGTTGQPLPGALGNLTAYEPWAVGGVFVAAGDVDGDGRADLITGPGPEHSPQVKEFSGRTGALLRQWQAYEPTFLGGVRVASAYVDGDAAADVVTAKGVAGEPRVREFSGATGLPLTNAGANFLAYPADYLSGVFVAAANDPTPVVTVTIEPKAQTVPSGQAVTVTVSWVSDTMPWGSWSVFMNWGDSNYQGGSSSAGLTGSWTFTHTYSSNGKYDLHALVTAASSSGSIGGSDGGVATVGAGPASLPPEPNCGCDAKPGGGRADRVFTGHQVGDDRPSGFSVWPVRYFDGAAWVAAPDLSSDGFGTAWGQTRTWTNLANYTSGAFNGNGWVDSELPYLVQVAGNNTLAAVSNGTTARTFDLVGGAYQPRFYVQDQLTYDSSAGEFVLTDTKGDQVRYYDFSTSLPAAQRGAFKSFTDPGGVAASVTAHTSAGKVQEVQRGDGTVTESYLYSYVASGAGAGQLSNVTLRRRVGSGSWSTVRQVDYAYYDGTEAHGNAGDLKTAVIKDGGGTALNTWYYRYYVSGEANGYQGGLKYAFGPQSYARLAAAYATPSSATDAQAAPYADLYFEYDSSHRVSKEVAQGTGCSSCSAGLGTYTYAYTASSFAPGENAWAVKTVETLPDGNTDTVYTNYAGEVMLEAFTDTAASLTWSTFSRYDAQGRMTLQAAPSAVSGYDDTKADLVNYSSGNYQYLRDADGLVRVTDYAASTTATSTTAGNLAGYVRGHKVQHGEAGTPIAVDAAQYVSRTGGSVTVAAQASATAYRNTDGTGGETTSYAYTWITGTVRPQSVTVTYPTVTTAQNGPGTADTAALYFDAYGRPVWLKDGDGFLTYAAYDNATGSATKTIADVDRTHTSDFTGLPSGWATPSGGGLHLVTQHEVDGLGRSTKTTAPDGKITYTVFNDPNYETRVYPGWNTTTGAPTGPTEVFREDRPGSYTEALTMSAAPHLTGGRPDGTEAVSGLQTLARSYASAAGQVVSADAYVSLSGLTYSTSTTLGTENTNYYRTRLGYDDRGRRDRTQAPTGTIYRTVYDGLGRPVSSWVGTNDTPPSGEWSPTNNGSPSNMVKVSEDVYDGGGVGDSNLTQTTSYPGGGAANRVGQMFYDWRDRLVAMKAGVQTTEATTVHRPITYLTYDNLDEVTRAQRYDGDGVTITTTGGVPQAPSSSLLRAQADTSYDERGRVYHTATYRVDPSSGAVSSSALTSDVWYDHRGQVIKTAAPGGLVSKAQYDGDGRVTKAIVTDGGGDSSWSDAGNVTGDAVLEQSEAQYDAAGNVLLMTARRRFHDETATGALGDPATAPKARVSYAANYYDLANRLTDSVDVGTNGGSSYTRPSSVPSRSDTALVSSVAYNAAGWVDTTTDPRGLVTKSYYDNLGRVTKTVEAYDGGSQTATTNKTTEFSYDGVGHLLTLQADLPGGSYQQTGYVYGVTTGSGSGINSNDVLSATKWPDKSTGVASSSEKETYTVDALGEVVTASDRNGSTHTVSYDVLGRQTADAVTTLGSGVDGSVRRIETAYDTQGNAYLFTSYDASSGGSIVNQVQRAFNGLGQLITEYQSHSGSVNTSTTPKVQYAYSEMSGGANHSRLTSVTYPNGKVLTYNYASSLDSSISRLSSLSDTSGTLESYSYLGLGTVVIRAHAQPGVDLTYVKQSGESNGDAGDPYTGLDRFGRVVDQRWRKTSDGSSTDRFKYGYDRDGNRLYRTNEVNHSFDELYHANGASNGYDPLNQLSAFARGTLSDTNSDGIPDTVATASRSQSWTLDGTGNFSSVTSDGTAQSRTHNKQNEVTGVGGNTLTFDANGNLTTDETGKQFVYDAWNRLVTVKNSGGTTLTSYQYDALRRRVVENPGTARDLYYSASWQVLEERVGGAAKTQYVWSPVYVDALVLRDRDADGNSANGLEERLWVQQDANFNVTALLTNAGAVAERYAYDPYGAATVLDASWATRGSSSYGWQYLHQGGRLDATSGLYHFRMRDLSPTLGHWAQADPLGFAAGDTNLYRFVANTPTTLVDPWGLYERDIHYYMTLYIALAAGIPFDVALQIAWSDQYVDEHPSTAPVQITPGSGRMRWRYHFRHGPDQGSRGTPGVRRGSDFAAEPANDGLAQGNPFLFGIGMHAYQDSWSHEGWYSGFGHAIAGHRPDHPYVDVDKAMEMAEATYNMMKKYAEKHHKGGKSKSFADIKSTLKTQMRRRGTEKERVLMWAGMIVDELKLRYDDIRFNDEPDAAWKKKFEKAADSVKCPGE